MMRDIKSMDLEELTQALSALGEPKFRAGQVFTWLHRGAKSFEEMTNLSKQPGRGWRRSLPCARRRWCASRSPGQTAPSNTFGAFATATAWNRW